MGKHALNFKKCIAPVFLGVFVLAGLYLASIFNYPLFHSLAELFSVIVACAIFILAWNTRHLLDNHYLLFIGISYLFVAAIDIVHTLAYEGMGVFPSFDANLPTQLWIIARYMESISLCLAPFFIRRKLRPWPVFAVYALVSSLLLLTVFYGNNFPVCYVEGRGLTEFKIVSEYVISLILLVSLLLLFINRKAFERYVLGFLATSIILTIASELAFTAYVSVYGFANMIGHIFKLLSFCCIYEAIIVMGLQKPYSLLFRDLKQREEQISDLNIHLEDKVRERTAQLEISHEALRESGGKYRTLIENIQDGIYILDPQGNFTFVNDVIVKRSGFPAEWFLGRNCFDFVSEADRERAQGHFNAAMDGKTLLFPLSYTTKSGNLIHIEICAAPLFDNSKVIGLLGISRDITERMQAEERFQKVHREWENIFQAIGHPTLILSPQHDIMAANRAALLAAGMTEQAIVGKKCYEVFHGKDTLFPPDCCPLEKLLSSGRLETYEMQIEILGGVFLISCTPVFNNQGQLEKIIHIAMDITERKLAEEHLQTSLKEKELLIREVHHRVKNNMQVMSGLLDLQASSSSSPELTAMLKESQRRIRAMAMVHEKLYDSDDLTRIDLAAYVKTLSQKLFQAYRINPGKIGLVIKTDGAVYVDIGKATPCGLVLNELISNALKHAFPGDKQGKLEIIIGETKDAEIEIVVRDNGSGLPDDTDINQSRSVGLRLVNGLVINQLHGQIEVRRDGGTEFRISFPLSFVEKGE